MEQKQNSKDMNEAAETYAGDGYKDSPYKGMVVKSFTAGALSDAAKEYWKEYWFEKFKLEYERLNAAQFQSEQKPSRVWVKVADRLPKEQKWYCCRHLISWDAWWYVSGLWTGYKFNDEQITEWLDESTQKPLTDAEIEALAEKEYPLYPWDDVGNLVRKLAFIKGYKAALNLPSTTRRH